MRPAFTIAGRRGHLVATALHAGHDIRPEVADVIALDDATRLHEEDPGTDRVAAIAPLRAVVHRSRFEVDLNRPRHEAVYRHPDDAWGLEVWREPPSDDLVAGSLAIYDGFYESVARQFDALAADGAFLVLDVHSYNHRRCDSGGSPAPEKGNPEVNVGTGTLDRARWGPVVDRFIDALGRQEVRGHRVDVRENVRFRGAHFAAWTHGCYPDSSVVLAVELKKLYMDEWSGVIDFRHLDELRRALGAAMPAVLDTLAECAA
jgi:N-formylglutamate amidohydrolase